MENIREFLEAELKKRGWKQADLARASNLDSAVVSNIINGRRRMGEETGKAIAHALQLPPEQVFRAAGLLPPIPPKHSQINELDHLAYLLGEEDLEEVIEYAKMRLKKRQEKVIYKQKSSRSIRPARSALKE